LFKLTNCSEYRETIWFNLNNVMIVFDSAHKRFVW